MTSRVNVKIFTMIALGLITLLLAAVIISGCGKCSDFAGTTVPEQSRETAGQSTASPQSTRDADVQDLAGQKAKIRVVATIFPLADIARNIGGNRVEVVTLLPPGANPHIFEVTTQQMKECSGAQLYIKIGAGLDDWADKIMVSAADNPVWIEAAEEIELLHANNGKFHDGKDPHIWLDPVLVKNEIAPRIARSLSALQPDSAGYFNNNLEKYSLQLEKLDTEIRNKVSLLQNRKFISLHSCWKYFARRYGLKEVATIEEYPGKEPSAKWLAGVIDTVKKRDAGAIFAESQLNPKAAEVIAEETGLEVFILDPIGKNSYIGLMRHNAEIISQALGN